MCPPYNNYIIIFLIICQSLFVLFSAQQFSSAPFKISALMFNMSPRFDKHHLFYKRLKQILIYTVLEYRLLQIFLHLYEPYSCYQQLYYTALFFIFQYFSVNFQNFLVVIYMYIKALSE